MPTDHRPDPSASTGAGVADVLAAQAAAAAHHRRLQAEALAGPEPVWEVAAIDLADAIEAANAGTSDDETEYRPLRLDAGWEPITVADIGGAPCLVVRRRVQ